MPLRSFELSNYRAFVAPTLVELRPLTLLFGYNNVGKSALARVLPLLRDSVVHRSGLPLNLESPAVRGGEFEDLRSRHSKNRRIELTLRWSEDDDADVVAFHVVFQDLPERRQHVVESFATTDRNGTRRGFTWDAANSEPNSYMTYSVDRPDLAPWKSAFLWDCLAPLQMMMTPPEDLSEIPNTIKNLSRQLTGLHGVYWVGATRKPQPRSSKFPRIRPQNIEHDGQRAGDVLAWDKMYHGGVFAKVAKWYQDCAKAKLDVAIKGDSYELVTGDYQVNLCDTGEGLTQALPPLVAAAMAAERSLVGDAYAVVEQPELHLHPALHSQLAGYFCDLAAKHPNQRLVVETHSENFLLGVQIAIASGTLDPSDVLVHWVTQGEASSAVEPIEFDQAGKLSAWPRGVFNEEVGLAKELIEARRKRRE